MATCQCGADLPGRRKKCDDCKKHPGRVAPPPPPPPVYPAGLHDRGRQLWDGIGQTLDTPAGQLALEACRLADRLEELDRVISGKGVLNLMHLQLHIDLAELLDNASDTKRFEISIHVGDVLTKTRLHQATFKEILKQLAELKLKTAKEPAPAGQPAEGGAAAPAPSATPLNELEQRRRQREQEA